MHDSSDVSPVYHADKGSVAQSDGRFKIRNASKTIYSDLPNAEAKRLEGEIIWQSYNVQLTELTDEGYRYVPSTYLIYDSDQAVPAQFQQIFADRLVTKKMRVEKIPRAMLRKSRNRRAIGAQVYLLTTSILAILAILPSSAR